MLELDQFRILIALSLAKQKPPGVSHQAYILSLRTRYALERGSKTSDIVTRLLEDYRVFTSQLESSTRAAGKDADDPYADDNFSPPAEPQRDGVTTSSGQSKAEEQKAKRKPGTEWSVCHAARMIGEDGMGEIHRTLIRAARFRAVLAAVEELFSRARLGEPSSNSIGDSDGGAQSAAAGETLGAVFLDAVQELGRMLGLVLREDRTRESVTALRVLCSLVAEKAMGCFPASVPSGQQAKASVAAHFSSEILVPILACFQDLSEAWVLESFTLSCKSKELESAEWKTTDLRPHLFQIVRDTIRQFFPNRGSKTAAMSKEDVVFIRNSLLLEAATRTRQVLTEALGATGPGSSEPPNVVRKRRMARLGAKDSLWYLCSVMHVLIQVPVDSEPEETHERAEVELGMARANSLLAHKVSEVIFGLIAEVSSRDGTSGRGMTLEQGGDHVDCRLGSELGWTWTVLGMVSCVVEGV